MVPSGRTDDEWQICQRSLRSRHMGMTRQNGPRNRTVVTLAYDGLCTFEFGVACELFGLDRPELEVDWYDFHVVSADPSPLRMVGGVTLQASGDLRLLETAGTIVIPGWKGADIPPQPAVLDALRAAHANGARIMTICSGVFALAATGLLDGLRATTHWRYTDTLRRQYPDIEIDADVLYVDNGQLLTSAGSAAGLDLGLHLIRRDFGAAVGNQVARRLVLPPARDGGQAQFIARPDAPSSAHDLAATLDWAIERLHEPLEVTDMARHAAMSPRTFARRFSAEVGLSPHRWLTQQRVLAAQALLESTSEPIDRVAAATGFGSAATLRHHFQRALKTTPSRYRAAFADLDTDQGAMRSMSH